jgi:KUP system potassium uptake protein
LKHETKGALALAALGVVFGDIGTSPLYAFQQCLTGDLPQSPTPENVLGILSLIFWALAIVVCVKYVAFMLRADYDGQGGILALLAHLSPANKKTGFPSKLTILAMVVLAGAAMLYGDGIITPAISVISAVEGIDVWTTAAHNYIVPISVAILLGLFYLQKRGTGSIGKLFGPVMILWFGVLGVFGAIAIVKNPVVLGAISPLPGFAFLIEHGFKGLLIFGAVVLCVTGVEALYADLAHFGRKPITIAWYAVVLPALLLNYFGQGANVLAHPQAALANTFYALFPPQILVGIVILATAATVIASQALITGVYSLTQQATQLGYSPRFQIVHTSSEHEGQIYMPVVTAMLAIGCIALVVAFRSSAALGAAYGLAVTVTMTTTTLAYAVLLRRKWNWSLAVVVPVIGLFLSWDLPFLAGNLLKIFSGAWLPIVIAGCLFVLFVTWNRGRRRMMERLAAHTMPVQQFLAESRPHAENVGGTAMFLSPSPEGIPFVMKHRWLRTHIAFDTIVLLTIVNVPRPKVPGTDRIDIEELGPRLIRVRAFYGFMQNATIADILRQLAKRRPQIDISNVTYYLASPKIYAAEKNDKPMSRWQFALYKALLRNARPLTDSLRLPPNRVVEFGVEVRI